MSISKKIIFFSLIISSVFSYAVEGDWLGITPDNMEIYQDVLIHDTVYLKGRVDCKNRYKTIKPILEKYNRSFTVFDLGASQGFMGLSIAKDFPNATVIMVEAGEKEAKYLQKICCINNLKNVVLCNKRLNYEDLYILSKAEHFDVVLALNVLHHFHGEELKSLDLLFDLADHIIIENPPIGDHLACNYQGGIVPLEHQLNSMGGEIIFKQSRHTGPHLTAKTRYFKGNLPGIEWRDVCVRKNFRIEGAMPYFIHSDFDDKLFFKMKGNEVHVSSWSKGINFVSFLHLNGIWPKKESLLNLFSLSNFENLSKFNITDFSPWNLILQGHSIAVIDQSDCTELQLEKKYLQYILSLVDLSYEKRKGSIQYISNLGWNNYFYNNKETSKEVEYPFAKPIEISTISNPFIMKDFHLDPSIATEKDKLVRNAYRNKLKKEYIFQLTRKSQFLN